MIRDFTRAEKKTLIAGAIARADRLTSPLQALHCRKFESDEYR